MEMARVGRTYVEGFVHSPRVNAVFNALGFKGGELSTQSKVIAIASAMLLGALAVYGICSFLNRKVSPQSGTTQEKLKDPLPESRKARVYTGDLTSEEKKSIGARQEKGKTDLEIFFENYKSVNFTIRFEDIFGSKAQVIVNAANTHLWGGGGIDGAIHSKAGAAYENEHQGLRNIDIYRRGYLMGHANMITSGELKESHGIQNVIVVAGPTQGDHSKNQTIAENALYGCYYNSLVLAHENNVSSIAFPSISTGIFAFPKDRAANISLKAIYDFICKYPNSSLRTISIHFLNDRNAQENVQFYIDAIQSPV